MSGPEFTGTEVPEQFLKNFEFKIAITFPGEVKSATGEIDGRTVTWQPKFGENTPVEAVASAIPSASSPLLMILLIVAGALVLGAIAFMLTHRKATAPATGPIDDASTTPFDTTLPAMPEDPVAPATPIVSPPPAHSHDSGRKPAGSPRDAGRRGPARRRTTDAAGLIVVPTYEYRCRTCGATFESRRTFDDADRRYPVPRRTSKHCAITVSVRSRNNDNA